MPEGRVIGIACNKADLDGDRVVSFERAEGFAKSIIICFHVIETLFGRDFEY